MSTSLPQNPSEHRVVVLGATPKPARYAYQAVQQLHANGYQVLPIHPKIGEIEGIPVFSQLAQVAQPIHTLTLYIGPQRSDAMVEEILAAQPQRVIFNPGTESTPLQQALEQQGAECVIGCTLVMLRTQQF